MPGAVAPPSSAQGRAWGARIQGGSAVGTVLTALMPASVSATTVQWTRNGTDIPGATGPTYTTTDADGGKAISYRYVPVVAAGVSVVVDPVIVASLFPNAIAAARRNNGYLLFVPDSLGSIYQDSAGATLPALGAPVGMAPDRSYGVDTLGPELFGQPMTIANGAESQQIGGLTAGATYRVSGAAGIKLNFGPGWTTNLVEAQTLSSNGTSCRFRNESGAPITFTPSVREVISGSNLGPELSGMVGLAQDYSSTYWGPAMTLEVGKTYEVTFKGWIASGSTFDVGVVNSSYTWFPNAFRRPVGSALLAYRTTFVATSTTGMPAVVCSGATGRVESLSVKELKGYHAIQPTAANKPTLIRIPRRLGPDLLLDKSPISNGGIRGVLAAPLALGKSYVVSGALSADLRAHDNTGVFSVPANRVVVPNPAGGGMLNLYNAGASPIPIADVKVQEVLEWSFALNFDRLNDVLVSGMLCGDAGTIIAAHQVLPVTGAWQAIAGTGSAPTTTTKGVRLRSATNTPQTAGIDVAWSATSSFVNSGNLLAPTVVQSGSWDANAIRGYLNGAAAGSATAAAGIGNGQPFCIGALNSSGADAFSGAIALLCITPNVMPDADRIAVERLGAYLAGVTAYVG